MKRGFFTSLMLILIFSSCFLNAQNAIISSGSNASGAGGSVSYSAGQVVYRTQTSTIGKINQGVQQPYEFYITSVATNRNILLEMMVYPNPTRTVVNLRIDNAENKEDLFYLLYDIKGTLLKQQNIINQITEIPLSDFAVGNYILKVTNQQLEILQTFKIIKN